MAGDFSLDKVVRAWIKLRDEKQAIENEAKVKTADINSKMGQLEAFLLAQMDEQGVSSYKTKYGTAFKTSSDYASVADWDAVIEFVKSADAYHILEHRVNKMAIRDHLKENDGAVPPGITYGTKYDINIRRPATK